jgi:ribosomal protein S12 methylthiotransferase accessory factor
MEVIGLVGLGETGTAALAALLERGYCHFVLADDGPVPPFEAPSSGVLVREDIGKPRSQALIERLGVRHPAAHFQLGSSPGSGLAWYLPWLERCAICLLAADSAVVSTLVAVNAACLDQRVPLLPAIVMGGVGQLGPWVVGDGSPCLGCLELRVRTAGGHSAYPPPVSPDHAIAAWLGRASADEADRYFTDRDRMRVRGTVQYQWGKDSTRTHPVLRCPGCAHCSTRSPRMPFAAPQELDLRDGPPSDPLQILKLTPRLVDPVTGPIKSLTRFTPGPTDPALHHWVTALADPGWDGFGQNTVLCGGNALSSDVAQAAALGEAVERSSTCHASFADVLVARYRDLASDAVDPLAWDLFEERTRSRADFPFVAPSRDAELSWVWGYSLTDRRPVRVPASRVFSPYRVVAPGDAFDAPLISGYATGITLAEAVYAALMEVIERDAFMIAWANQLSAPRLAINHSSPEEVGSYLAAVEACGIEVRCVLIKLDLGAHTVVALARDLRPGEPTSVVSAAADVDASAACRRALKELTANRLSVRDEMRQGAAPTEADPESVIDERSHGLLFAKPEMAPCLDFWWRSPTEVALPLGASESSAGARVQKCVEVIATAGLQVIAIDLTAPAMAALGLRTVKVVVPGAYPMNFDGRFPHFGGPRMLRVTAALGLRDKAMAVEELSRLPHPFP